jgi:hypothetical protein
LKNIIVFIIISITTWGCTKDVPCSDRDIRIIFTGFTLPEIDTFVLRKFKPGDNYQHLIDTVNIFYDSTVYSTSNDTTIINLNYPMQGIMARNDWQIYIPGAGKTVSLSGFVTEQKSGPCGAITPTARCGCINKIYSLKEDNIFIDFSNLNQNSDAYQIYIDK